MPIVALRKWCQIILGNLRPICSNCNKSIRKSNMKEFIEKSLIEQHNFSYCKIYFNYH